MENEEQKVEERKIWIPTKKFISEALIVAILTAAAYLAAFAYQFSYLNYFGVPWMFIDVNVGLVLFTSFIMILYFSSFAFAFIYLAQWQTKSIFISSIKNILSFVLLIIGLFVPILAVVYVPQFPLINVVGFLILVIVFIILIIRFSNNGRHTEKGLLKFLDRTEDIYGTFPVLFCGVIFLFIIGGYVAGSFAAKGKSNFLVTDTNPNLIIVSTYSGDFIGLTFSTTTKTFDRKITLISQEKASDEGIIFSDEKLGTLSPSGEIGNI